jgi:hypothetical protein
VTLPGRLFLNNFYKEINFFVRQPVHIRHVRFECPLWLYLNLIKNGLFYFLIYVKMIGQARVFKIEMRGQAVADLQKK